MYVQIFFHCLKNENKTPAIQTSSVYTTVKTISRAQTSLYRDHQTPSENILSMLLSNYPNPHHPVKEVGVIGDITNTLEANSQTNTEKCDEMG